MFNTSEYFYRVKNVTARRLLSLSVEQDLH
jgi:hypothetical protein